MRARLKFSLVLCALFLAAAAPAAAKAATPAQAARAARASEVKAAFLYKFASFVEWPPGTFQRPDQPLVIAVLGDDEVAANLEQLIAGRNVEGRPVVAKRIPEGASTSGAHILLIGERRESRLREAIEQASGPVLVVTEQAEGLRLGAVLDFSDEEGRVRFSASLAAAETRNIKLSARLLTVALRTEGRTR